MIQIWQVPSECSPSNLVVLGLPYIGVISAIVQFIGRLGRATCTVHLISSAQTSHEGIKYTSQRAYCPNIYTVLEGIDLLIQDYDGDMVEKYAFRLV